MIAKLESNLPQTQYESTGSGFFGLSSSPSLGLNVIQFTFFWKGTIFIIYPFPCINHSKCDSPFDNKSILHSVLVSIGKASTQTWQKRPVPPWHRSLSPVMKKHSLLFDGNKTLIQPRARRCSFAAFYLWGWGDDEDAVDKMTRCGWYFFLKFVKPVLCCVSSSGSCYGWSDRPPCRFVMVMIWNHGDGDRRDLKLSSTWVW